MYMMEQCRLYNKTLIFESVTGSTSHKEVFNSFIEHAIKDGIDCVIVNEEHSSDETYISLMKTYITNIVLMESLVDNNLKNQELSK